MECVAAALVCLYFRKQKAAIWLLGIALVVAYLPATEIVATMLVKKVERTYLPVDIYSVKGDAIVVLGGGGRPKSYPRTNVEFSEAGERMFHGIRLFKAGAAPVVIVSGGGIDFILKDQCEGRDMAELMIEFGMPADSIIIEDKARNTYENALYVKEIMEEKKMGKNIVLVSSALHMVRSVPIFRRMGFTVIPAPCDYIAEEKPYNWFSLLPNAWNLAWSSSVMKEMLGIAVYKMKGWL